MNTSQYLFCASHTPAADHIAMAAGPTPVADKQLYSSPAQFLQEHPRCAIGRAITTSGATEENAA